ncbi:hypothetical protein NM688_g1700 [Phlebia brevispora]|uniref:Uncharacterized protein n=1 Tax=Phlebia brevispora TaxID=194682 RepID=A0ACC1TAG2_9APHY|nr:hypothetical protein NM688_g1700 [Phlebia brevispora]
MERIRKRLIQEQADQFQGIGGSVLTSPSTPVVPALLCSASSSRRRSGSPHIVSSKDWKIDDLLSQGSNFKEVKRVSALSEEEMLRVIEEHESSGEPLIVENWHLHPKWPEEMFSAGWLLDRIGRDTWRIRNVRDRTDIDMTVEDFIRHSQTTTVCDGTRVLYGKDAPCPEEWKQWIYSAEVLPSSVCPNGPDNLLTNLTASEAVESLMCYLGAGDTLTPCHKDLCASSGHNLMCYTENGGSSFWFMTASGDAPKADAYFQTEIGLALDWEAHTASVEEFANANFPVYIAEQKLGDLVLVPPRSCHQVINHSGLTIKTAWSRMTIRGLGAALHHELPIYRRVCREEQYRVKYIIYRSLLRATEDMKAAAATPGSSLIKSPRRQQQAKSMRDLIELMDYIIYDEFTPGHKSLPTILSAGQGTSSPSRSSRPRRESMSERQVKTLITGDSVNSPEKLCNFACDFCGADIFHGFFECNDCVLEREDGATGDRPDNIEVSPDALGNGLILCPGCYAEGRTCTCGVMHAAQCRPFAVLLDTRNKAADVLKSVSASSGRRDPCQDTLSEEDIKNSNEIQMFHAGCELLAMRENAGIKVNTTRTCSTSGKPSHEVPYMHALYCDPCHRSMCFSRICNVGIHSADALLSYIAGKQEWHVRHTGAQKEFRQGVLTVQNAERSGAITIYRDRLVIAARQYRVCRPMYRECVKLGWYDQEEDLEADRPDSETSSDPLEINPSVPDNSAIDVVQDEQIPSIGDAERSISRASESPVTRGRLSSGAQSGSHILYTPSAKSVAKSEDESSEESALTPISSPAASRAASPAPSRRRRLQVYVLLPPRVRGRKRRKLPEDQLHRTFNIDTDGLADERLRADYSSSLVEVINAGNTANHRSYLAQKQRSSPKKKSARPREEVDLVNVSNSEDDRPIGSPPVKRTYGKRTLESLPLFSRVPPPEDPIPDAVRMTERTPRDEPIGIQDPSGRSIRRVGPPGHKRTRKSQTMGNPATKAPAVIPVPLATKVVATIDNTSRTDGALVSQTDAAAIGNSTRPKGAMTAFLRRPKNECVELGDQPARHSLGRFRRVRQEKYPPGQPPGQKYFPSATKVSTSHKPSDAPALTQLEVSEIQKTIQQLVDRVVSLERELVLKDTAINALRRDLENQQKDRQDLLAAVTGIPQVVTDSVQELLPGLKDSLKEEIYQRVLCQITPPGCASNMSTGPALWRSPPEPWRQPPGNKPDWGNQAHDRDRGSRHAQ